MKHSKSVREQLEELRDRHSQLCETMHLANRQIRKLKTENLTLKRELRQARERIEELEPLAAEAEEERLRAEYLRTANQNRNLDQ